MQELDAIELGAHGKLTSERIHAQNSNPPNDLEASGMSKPRQPDVTNVVPSFSCPSMNK